MAKIGVTLLLVWASLATAAAAWLLVDRRAAPAVPEPPARSGSRSEETETLLQRMRALQAEGALPDPAADDLARAGEDAAHPDGTGWIMPTEASIRALIQSYRKTVENGAARDDDLQRALERIVFAAEHDARAHLVLLDLIGIATAEEDLEDFVDALQMPFDKPRHPAVTPRVLEAASRLFRTDPDPRRCRAGGKILTGYTSPSPKDFRIWLDTALAETNAAMRSYLLGEMSSCGWGLELPSADVQAFLEMLRRQVRAGNIAHVSALAHWSDLRQDFDLAFSLLGTVRDPERRRSVLTAFRGGVPLTRGREEESRGILIRMLSDGTEERSVRNYALVLLEEHRPWDEPTAAAVRRYREERKGE